MKIALSTLLFSIILLYSCIKTHSEEDCTTSFYGEIPIASSQSPDSVKLGDTIVSRVKCELRMISGNFAFKGFTIQASPSLDFDIKATAQFINWNKCVALQVISGFDTTLNIPTTVKGKYILTFHDYGDVRHQDTIQVY